MPRLLPPPPVRALPGGLPPPLHRLPCPIGPHSRLL
uniref:Uncharacterized protein n=1 Tax=Arundo donax TaxID=35708 RepID=A0A0A8YYU3_ARUDO